MAETRALRVSAQPYRVPTEIPSAGSGAIPATRRADRVRACFCAAAAQAFLKIPEETFHGEAVFELNQSLDGYLDHQAFGPPDPALFRHFTEQVRGLAGMLYGRGMYEVMRYWDEDSPDWGADEREYVAVWRSQPKWVVSRSLMAMLDGSRQSFSGHVAGESSGVCALPATQHPAASPVAHRGCQEARPAATRMGKDRDPGAARSRT